MIHSLKKTGAPSLDELRAAPCFPSAEQLRRGPIAVIECVEEIPCNPCEAACPKGAIRVGTPITNLPVIDFDRCVGCGSCIAPCPGLAIYVKDYNYSEAQASISFPFEYLPLPHVGAAVNMVGRHGEAVCEGTTLRVQTTKANNRTAVVTVAFPKEYFDEVISMKRLE
jgi:Fe-S-cluster-containing hydrogenase component 2